MDGITFTTSTSTLDDKLLRDVYRVVSSSMRTNSRYYNPSAIEVALQAYEPHRFKEWSQPALSLFAYDGAKPVGTGFLKHRKFDNVATKTEGGYLFGEFVDPEYQGRGIGRTIAQKLIEYAQQIGIKVLRGNASEASLKLCQDLGFVEIGKYKDGALKAELHIMELRLA